VVPTTALSNLSLVYRFLFTPGWLARLAAALAIAAVMVLLGNWQLSRYEERSAVNARIDAAQVETAVPLGELLAAPDTGDEVGPAAPAGAIWTMATATGRYDPEHELLARGRTVDGRVGFEVLTPLVLADGSAVLIDRGWVPPAEAGLAAAPEVPRPPAGSVTVAGRVRPSESEGSPVERHGGAPQTRRIHLDSVAAGLPYPLYGAYLTLDSQQPPTDPGLTPIPVRRENAWLNAGYTAQWWLFAAMVLAGFGWLVKREGRRRGAGPVPSRL
jgi:cytochrome oxidase assembly protein ShyY1